MVRPIPPLVLGSLLIAVVGACHDDPPATVTVDPVAPVARTAPAAPPPLAGDTSEQTSLIEAAKAALSVGDERAAETAFEALVASEPMSGAKLTGVISLADLRLSQGNPKAAVALIDGVMGKAPPTAELSFLSGRAHKEAGDLPRAIAAFQSALALQPLLLQAHVELGGLYASTGDGERSAQAYLAYERAVYKYSKILEDPEAHPEDKLKIIEVFGFIPDDRAATALLACLDDSERLVRLAAARELAEVCPRSALPTLEQARDTALSRGDRELGAALDAAIVKVQRSPAEPSTDDSPALGPKFIVDGKRPDVGTVDVDGGDVAGAGGPPASAPKP